MLRKHSQTARDRTERLSLACANVLQIYSIQCVRGYVVQHTFTRAKQSLQMLWIRWLSPIGKSMDDEV